MHVVRQLARLAGKKLLGIALLVAAPFAIYSNNYRHAFHLDDAYTLVNNPSVRSLSTIPRYFVDPGTYTSVREQADYRPILQVTYALNYRLGGYDTRWWHFTQILLHALVTLGIFALCRRVLLLQRDPPPNPDRIAFAAALIFAIHPAASGVVNYFNARSSLLTAAFLLPALLAYMRSAPGKPYDRPQWLAALFYALALFTKVEAVGALGALWAFDLWQRARETPERSFAGAVRDTFDGRTLRRLAPALAITAVYFVLRWRVMAPFPFADTRHAPDVGAYTYFLTQLTAWWHYVLRWLAPVRLVADNLAYPVYRSWYEPVVLLALGAWVLVGTALIAAWRRAPYLMFLAIAALALLSPTSSVAPLAEMVNEHRPYLPIGILSLALVIPAGTLLRQWPARGATRAAIAGGAAVILVALTTLTYRRNEVFSTSERFWRDVLAKAPSSRAHLNYGVSLMAANDMTGAMRQFQSSLELAPYWYYTHINLGVAYNRLGDVERARGHYDRAVEYDRYSGSALTWRGEFHLALREYAAARDDFLASGRVSLEPYRNAKGLAAAYAGLGDTQRSLEQTERMLAIEPLAASTDAQAALVQQGMSLLHERKDPVAAEAAFRKVLELNPAHYGATYQLAVALDRAGRTAEARRQWETVLKNAEAAQDTASARVARSRLVGGDSLSEERRMALGLDLLYRQKNARAAAEHFRRVLERRPTHYGATFQLATALDRAGDSANARALWEKVLGMAIASRDQRTADIARARLR